MNNVCSQLKSFKYMVGWLVGWLVGFYGKSTFVGYLTPNPFLCKLSVLFQTIQFSISTQFKCKYSLIVKNISISSYSV